MKQIILLLIDCISQLKVKSARVPVFPKVEGVIRLLASSILSPFQTGWMDGRLDVWMDGWMFKCLDGWMDGWMDDWIDGWMYGWVEELIRLLASSILSPFQTQLGEQMDGYWTGTSLMFIIVTYIISFDAT